MAYPIFDDTMVDLSWPEVEKAANARTPVILPVSTIEEHGPHMNLAPDIYLTHQLSKRCKELLKKMDIDIIIAPPVYWGINHCTGAFPGSFLIRPETMIALLNDIFFSLQKWGFSTIFIITMHGDPLHKKIIINSIMQAREQLNIDVRLIEHESVLRFINLKGTESYILTFTCEDTHEGPIDLEFADVHAGAMETSSMLNDFPEAVNREMIKTLSNSNIKFEQLNQWFGETARAMTPFGYCGNPSNIILEVAAKTDSVIAAGIVASIANYLKKQ